MQKEADGGYRLEMSVLEEGQRGVVDCLENFVFVQPDVCATARPLPARRLSPEEAQAALQLFSAIRIFTAPDPICECIVFDPCVVRSFQWDGERVIISDFCAASWIDHAESGRILDLLEGLRLPR